MEQRGVRRAALSVALALAAGATLAQEPQITNEASGLACYDAQHLLEAHNALGFYNMARVREFIAAERCFAMQPEWEVRIDDDRFVGGVEVTMLRVRLEVSEYEARFAWTLEGNIARDSN